MVCMMYGLLTDPLPGQEVLQLCRPPVQLKDQSRARMPITGRETSHRVCYQSQAVLPATGRDMNHGP